MSKLFLDVLDNDRKRVFEKLAAFRNVGNLGGGTAIALQINHRRSFDFDIFVSKPIDKNLLKKAHQILGPGATQTLNVSDQINLLTPQGVSVTFFYDAAPLLSPIETPHLNLLDIRDLASNKATTIGFRGKWRDYVDMYFILKEKRTTLKEIIEISQKRRGSLFSTRLFLQQLTYFDDLTDFVVDLVGPEISPTEIKKFLCNQTSALAPQEIK